MHTWIRDVVPHFVGEGNAGGLACNNLVHTVKGCVCTQPDIKY